MSEQQQELIRIGRQPTAPAAPKPRQKASSWIVAAAVVFAVAIFATVALLTNPPWNVSPVAGSPSAAAANAVECENVRRAYVVWFADKGELTHLIADEGIRAEFTAESLLDAADEFAKATDGYTDTQAKTLHLKALEYQFEVGLLHLWAMNGKAIDAARHAKAMDAWSVVEGHYAEFMRVTCGVS